MPPQWPDFVLSSHIPDVELDILVGDCFDVEADCGYRGDVLVQFEFVEDCWMEEVSARRNTKLASSDLMEGTQIETKTGSILVFPAASSPSMSRRISLDPKILPIIFDIWPPIMLL